ncbi:hypothetical protein TCAL_16595 [Tigriopus californicus]|uniref:Uncharacterized protein n=1 Tax=Tigriopus californicus TaxID=6832 RepID=A0A553NBC1_TIGCA|nr:uncharacterized protein LOC131888451 [Tigriopus californicus]XP_059093287.1 uncharacterized protein LOC131888451 [Tigriopus californicus]XP_059093288.1 uncharacterized protein LOC131888451 [Tigriopus californicus]TRY62730.1 hypothetical protein TCAL_16595 [Tigriopus californicus]
MRFVESGWGIIILLAVDFSYSRSESVIDCLSSSDRDRCAEESLCSSLLVGEICDGQLDCPNGSDEDATLCMDPRWNTIPCHYDNQRRCSGKRPGQCVNPDDFCDNIYQCSDRSDENFCLHFTKQFNQALPLSDSASESDPDEALADDQGDNNSDAKTFWIIVFLLCAIPLTWLFKGYFLSKFAVWFGTRITTSPELSLSMVSLRDAPDADILHMLEFIHTIRSHVIGDDPWEQIEDRMLKIFQRVHDTSTWDQNAKIIFDMGHLLFESDMNWIDEFHVAMHKLERLIHQNDELKVDLCLKHDLGNRYTYDLLWSTEPPGIRKLQCLCPDWFHRMWRSKWFKTVLIFLTITKEAVSYYLDLIKDWVIFIVLYNHARPEHFLEFEAQLLFLLALFLVVPELIQGGYFAHNYKIILGLKAYSFKTIPEVILKILLIPLSPFIPAILLLERGKIAYHNLRIQTILIERMEKYQDALPPKEIDGFKSNFELYQKALEDRDEFFAIIVDAKNLEASTETIFQYILQFMVLLVVRLALGTIVTDGIEKIFFSQVGNLLYVSLVFSFLSLISSRSGIEAWKKQGFFQSKSKILFGMSTFLALLGKVWSIVFYFAPTLGLFYMAVPWFKGRIPFAEDFNISNTTVSSIWVATDPTLGEFTLISLSTYYIFYLIFVPWQCVLLYMVKQFLVPAFRKSSGRSKKLLHIVSCLNFPSIFEDWDEKCSENVQEYDDRWKNVWFEHQLMIFFHGAINVLNCVPTVFCSVQILCRHQYLLQSWFQPTQEEHSAMIVAWILVFSPIYMLVLAYLQRKIILVYYKSGHPWSRIFVKLPSNQAPMESMEGENIHPTASTEQGLTGINVQS